MTTLTRWRCAARIALTLALAALLGTAGAQTPSGPPAEPPPLKGKLERIHVFGKSLEGNLLGETASPDVSIYLPPSYATERNRRYAVVYLLHGYTNSDLGYFGATESRQLHIIAERVFGAGQAKEMILVMPNCMNVFGGCMYSSSVTAGDWEGYVAEDLVAYMDSHYRTLARRESRGIAGHSMGGYGALRIGMKRPDVFSSLYALSSCCLNEGTVRARSNEPSPAETIHSIDEARGNRAAQGTLARAAAWAPNPANPPLFLDLPTKNGEVVPEVAVKWAANSPVAMLDQYVPNLRKYTAIQLDIGLQDTLLASNEIFIERLNRFGVPHTYLTYEGDHGNRIPQRLEQHVLPFFSQHLSFAQRR